MERRISHSATTLALNNPESIANMEIHLKIKMTITERQTLALWAPIQTTTTTKPINQL